MPALLLAILLFAACRDEPAPAVHVSRWQDLIVESRSLPADTTFSAVGLRPESDRDDRSTDWEVKFSDAEKPAAEDGFVRRDFRLTILNRGSSAIEFHGRLDYHAGVAGLHRRRSFDHLLVPPFTERSWIGSITMRAAAGIEPLVRIVPTSEPVDPFAGNE